MKKLIFCLLALSSLLSLNAQETNTDPAPDQVIFAFGGDINKPFIRYVAGLTGLPNPRVCYIPTASADHVYNINFWYEICHDLPLEPHVLRVWVSSSDDRLTFEEQLSDMDAIVVGGGNTLNMLAIWKAQGIDTVLRKCLEKGVVLAGGSAGSICWFTNGISDSRPRQLSIVEGLSFLKASNCPHYSEGDLRRKLYHEKLLDGSMAPGFGSDYYAGLLFINGHLVQAVSLNERNHSWFVSVRDGQVVEEKLASEVIK